MRAAVPIRTLIIEDIEDDALLLVNALTRSGFEPSYVRVDNYVDLLDALREEWDIVFSDYTMPGFNGKDALEIIRRHNADVPFIYVSGTIGEDRAVEAVKAGAQDYIIKGHYTRLPVAVNHALKEARMKREHRLAQEKIDQLINVDTLTGTATRAYFLETLMAALEKANAGGTKVALFFINIDRFRAINDGIGMKGGDALITELAQRLTGAVSSGDTVARLYADQFAIVAQSVDGATQLSTMADTLLACFEKPFSVNRYQKKVTASIGYCLFPDDGNDLQLLISNATLAQSHARHAKGNSVARYNVSARQDFEKRIFLESELESGIRRNEFVLQYQPQMDLKTGRIIGAESLVRWKYPAKGIISPMEFIPIAEETGLILPLGNEICRVACEQLATWIKAGLPRMRIAVNISSHQFQYEGFATALNDILEHCGIDPGWMELEITETALMNDADLAFSTMTLLSRLGFSIALDDFGTGYSSLSYLDRFPIDTLKIDRTFTSALPHDRRKATIVQAIIAMAEKLGVKVVAEGIETAEQLEFLRDSGCDVVQGYFIHRPMDADQVQPLLMASSTGL